ncbi:hypothetical protein DPX16_4379 [Anabarilius grahami]|uniref:Uncharacterized protein n=1 Tax=Anabarilius grahami TaxID=495550 RepID=A0A3N0Z549_ANAGA|nr:hypothetical protein DPX16_4379 [Anabarilius grahami]
MLDYKHQQTKPIIPPPAFGVVYHQLLFDAKIHLQALRPGDDRPQYRTFTGPRTELSCTSEQLTGERNISGY